MWSYISLLTIFDHASTIPLFVLSTFGMGIQRLNIANVRRSPAIFGTFRSCSQLTKSCDSILSHNKAFASHIVDAQCLAGLKIRNISTVASSVIQVIGDTAPCIDISTSKCCLNW